MCAAALLTLHPLLYIWFAINVFYTASNSISVSNKPAYMKVLSVLKNDLSLMSSTLQVIVSQLATSLHIWR
jgi:hypothetical protein